jgi:hypothetical protein
MPLFDAFSSREPCPLDRKTLQRHGSGPFDILTVSNRVKRAKLPPTGHLCWCNHPAFVPDTMIKPSAPSNVPVALPPLVAAYVEATNSFDLERLLATFAEDALVNDQLRDYWGKPAIREWAERDIIGERLTMNVTKVVNHYGNFIVTANVDGNYDKRGLPDPLVLAFYLTAQNDLIVQLIILRNRYEI